MFCADELKERMQELKKSQQGEDETPEKPDVAAHGKPGAAQDSEEQGRHEEEDDEEEEEEEEEEELRD